MLPTHPFAVAHWSENLQKTIKSLVSLPLMLALLAGSFLWLVVAVLVNQAESGAACWAFDNGGAP